MEERKWLCRDVRSLSGSGSVVGRARESWKWKLRFMGVDRMRDRREERDGYIFVHHSIPVLLPSCSYLIPLYCTTTPLHHHHHPPHKTSPLRKHPPHPLPSPIPTIPNRTDGRLKKFILPWFCRGGKEGPRRVDDGVGDGCRGGAGGWVWKWEVGYGRREERRVGGGVRSGKGGGG
jgi:hypothetical protein